MSVLLRPSNKAWPICSAQPWLAQENAHRIPADTSSAEADEGTIAHDRAERILLGEGNRPGKDDPLRVYIDFVLDTAEGEDLLVEQKMPTCVDPDYEGTVDAAVVTAGSKIHIMDLKWGVGQPVPAENNSQLLIYARSFYDRTVAPMIELDVYDPLEEVSMTIVQPRYHGEGSPISTWTMTYDQFIKASDLLMVKADLIRERIDLAFIPGSHCTFCPCQGFCLERHKHALANYPPRTATLECLSESEVATIYNDRKRVEKLLRQVTKHVEKTARAGISEFFGMATGTRAGNTTWTNAKAVVRNIRKLAGGRLGSRDLHTSTLLSPTAVKKLLTPEEIAEAEEKNLWYRPDPGKVVVPIEEADSVDVDEVFETLTSK